MVVYNGFSESVIWVVILVHRMQGSAHRSGTKEDFCAKDRNFGRFFRCLSRIILCAVGRYGPMAIFSEGPTYEASLGAILLKSVSFWWRGMCLSERGRFLSWEIQLFIA